MTDNPSNQAPETPATPAQAEGGEVPATDNAAPPGEAPENTDQGDNANDQEGSEGDDLLFEESGGDDPKEGEDGEGSEDGDDDSESGEENANAVDISALEIPEEMPIPEALKGDVDQLMKDLADANLTNQEKAQKIIDAHVKSQKHSLETWNKTTQEWRQETLDDPDIGGDNWKASQIAANKAIRAIWANEENGGSKELLENFQNDLKMLKLGNKLSFIKGMVNLSKMIGEDSQGDGQGGADSKQLSHAERLYGSDGQGRKSS